MKEYILHDNITFSTNNRSAIVSQPRKSPFDFPTAFITPHLAPITVVALRRFGVFSGLASVVAKHSNIVQRFFEQRDFIREQMAKMSWRFRMDNSKLRWTMVDRQSAIRGSRMRF
jgi:hypothetical protein